MPYRPDRENFPPEGTGRIPGWGWKISRGKPHPFRGLLDGCHLFQMSKRHSDKDFHRTTMAKISTKVFFFFLSFLSSEVNPFRVAFVIDRCALKHSQVSYRSLDRFYFDYSLWICYITCSMLFLYSSFFQFKINNII